MFETAFLFDMKKYFFWLNQSPKITLLGYCRFFTALIPLIKLTIENMKNLITLCFLLFAFITANAQKNTQEQATKSIMKNLTGQEYYYPVVGEMGYQKIDSAALDDTELFVFKNKSGKELFWFRIKDSTIDYDDGILTIWHGYYMHKLKMSKNKAQKVIEAFNSIKG